MSFGAMLLLGAKTKSAVLLFPRQTYDRFQKRPAPQPHYRRRAFQSQKQIVTSRGSQPSGAVPEPALVFDASQRHGEAAYMPDKHSTFIRSRFVLVSKERQVPDSIASHFGSISPNSSARHYVHVSCEFR